MRPLFWLFFVLLLLWLATVSYCHSLCNCGVATTSATAAPISAVTEKAAAPLRYIAVEDTDKNYTSKLYDNLLFEQSSCIYESPISDSLNMVFQSLAEHLRTNEDRILVLTGVYQTSENNTCVADDLGIARAESVRQLLLDKGVSTNQIRTGSSNSSVIDIVDDKIMGGIIYSFISGDLTDIENRLRARNITLYFDTNQQDISFTEEQEQYFEDLKYYLTQQPDARALVIGHTDDDGSASGNRRLSRKRAETVRDFMVEKFINRNQIIAKGMGPDEPIATNDTEEGKAQNRRVEITIQ